MRRGLTTGIGGVEFHWISKGDADQIVSVVVGSAVRVGDSLWVCDLRWKGYGLSLTQAFGADPLGATENALILIRAVIADDDVDWGRTLA